MKKIITGVLEAYWEQGMEGRIEYAFLPDDPHERGGGTLPIWLEAGQYLKIYNEHGAVLWAGVLEFVPRKWLIFYEKHSMPNDIWHAMKQRGVPYKDWIAWFCIQPPYRAELTVEDNPTP